MHSRLLRAFGVGLLALSIASPAATASAQQTPSSVAVVVGDLADIGTWGFTQTVPLGQPITWTNLGQLPHTVTIPDTPLDSGMVPPGASATLFFDAPGVYRYLCTLHPSMVGAVLVSEDPALSAPNLTIVEADLADPNSWGYALSVPVGQSVVWTNTDAIQPHTATATDLAWDTTNIPPGESIPLTFDVAGLYAYLCTPHPWMKGWLQVV
jgi:plastocyanin